MKCSCDDGDLDRHQPPSLHPPAGRALPGAAPPGPDLPPAPGAHLRPAQAGGQPQWGVRQEVPGQGAGRQGAGGRQSAVQTPTPTREEDTEDGEDDLRH